MQESSPLPTSFGALATAPSGAFNPTPVGSPPVTDQATSNIVLQSTDPATEGATAAAAPATTAASFSQTENDAHHLQRSAPTTTPPAAAAAAAAVAPHTASTDGSHAQGAGTSESTVVQSVKQTPAAQDQADMPASTVNMHTEGARDNLQQRTLSQALSTGLASSVHSGVPESARFDYSKCQLAAPNIMVDRASNKVTQCKPGFV